MHNRIGWTLDRFVLSGSNMRTSHHPLSLSSAMEMSEIDLIALENETYTAMMEQ